jgi:hypothetical protein
MNKEKGREDLHDQPSKMREEEDDEQRLLDDEDDDEPGWQGGPGRW